MPQYICILIPNYHLSFKLTPSVQLLEMIDLAKRHLKHKT